MPFAALPDVTLRFERHGAGSGGTPLVLLHGAMETFEACWKKPLPADIGTADGIRQALKALSKA